MHGAAPEGAMRKQERAVRGDGRGPPLGQRGSTVVVVSLARRSNNALFLLYWYCYFYILHNCHILGAGLLARRAARFLFWLCSPLRLSFLAL